MPSPNMSLYVVSNITLLQFLKRIPHGKHLCLKDKYKKESGWIILTFSIMRQSSKPGVQLIVLVLTIT
jgi:hypothetical protein